MKQTLTAWIVILMVCGLGSTLAASETVESRDAAALVTEAEAEAARPGWAEFLPVESQVLQAQKITLSYPIRFMAATDTAATSTTDADAKSKAASKTSSDAAPLKRHEIQYPTIYSGPRPSHTSFEKIVFDANLVYMVALNVADYFTTRAALKHEDLREANPIMQPFVKNDVVFGAVKLGLTMSSYFVMKSLFKKNKPLAWVASIAANVALSYVVVNNFRMIESMQPVPGSVCR
jgi:hypothetical protein